MVKDTLAILESSFDDEFELWSKTTGKNTLTKVDAFLKTVTGFNLLLFNTTTTMTSIKEALVKDEETQQGVFMFLLRVKYRFISKGGDWLELTLALNKISDSINKDNTFNNKLEGFEQTAELKEENMIQTLLYFYILTPSLIITRNYHVAEEE